MKLLVHGAHLWTGSQLLSDHGVLTEDGVVKQIGAFEALRAQHPDAEVVGGGASLVVPGLINAHHHGRGLTAFAAGTCDHCLEVWLANRTSEPGCDPYLDTLWAATRQLAAGFTTMVLFQATRRNDTALHEANERIRACRDAGIRVAMGLDLRQINRYVYGPDPAGLPALKGLTTQEYMEMLEALRKTWAHDPLVSIFAAPAGPQWATDETWQAIGAWSKTERLPIHTHCLESPYQKELARRAYNGSMVEYLDKMGALHDRTALIHGVWLSDAELERMAAVGASLVTNPSSNLRLRSGIGPVVRALRAGVNLALGTDGMSLGDREDAMAELQLLLALHRPPGLEEAHLGWDQALKMSTSGAAKVTPWGEQIGQLAEGSLADLSIYDLDAVKNPWVHPRHEPLQVLAQRGSAQALSAVVVNGRLVWKSGEGTLLCNEKQVAADLKEHMAGQNLPEKSPLADLVSDFYRGWNWKG